MRLIRSGQVEPERLTADKNGNPAKDAFIQVMVPEGPNFVMRVFTVKPGGHTPRHSHSFEHEVYVLAGKGRASGSSEFDMTPGDAIFVPAGDLHCFANTGTEDLKIICVVPRSDAGRAPSKRVGRLVPGARKRGGGAA
jgi:quercetin dioxygenase-like cupin family protein